MTGVKAMEHKAAVAARNVYQRLRNEAEAAGRPLGHYTTEVREAVASDPATSDLAPFLLANDDRFRRQLNNEKFKDRKTRGRPREALKAENRP